MRLENKYGEDKSFLDSGKAILDLAYNLQWRNTEFSMLGDKSFLYSGKAILDLAYNLQWGNSEFSMLGLKFSTIIEQIPSIKYIEMIQKKDIQKWQSRYMTPFGRITLIKTKFLPKLIHLVTSLPAPDGTLKQINNLVFEFIWNHKPDKVKRKTVCGDYSEGVLKLVTIFLFEKALKITWIRRTINRHE